MMLDDCEIRRMSDLLDLGALLGDDLASDTKNDGADIDDINISYSPYSSGEENHIALGITPDQLEGFRNVQIFPDSRSHSENDDETPLSERSPQKRGKRHRRLSQTVPQSKTKRPRSQSPVVSEESDDQIDTPNKAEDSKNETPTSTPESASDIDWDAFLWEKEMLPASNWEEEFLKHEAKLTDRYSYKGLVEVEAPEESGDSQDQPWYPYDPANIVDAHCVSEVDGEKFPDGAEGKICYGIIHKVRVKVLEQATELLRFMRTVRTTLETFNQQDIYTFEIYREGDSQQFLLRPPNSSDHGLQSFDSAQQPFSNELPLFDNQLQPIGTKLQLIKNIAVLNQESSSVLAQISSFCTFEAYSFVEHWADISNRATVAEKVQKDAYILVDVVIYGSQNHCQEVGDILDSRNVYLQEPDYRDTRLDYLNPHFIDWSSPQIEAIQDLDPLASSLRQAGLDFQYLQPANDQVITRSFLEQKIAAAFKTMTRAQTLKRIEGDTSIRTRLLPYQEEALDFIMQRESGPISEEYCLWQPSGLTSYIHSITGCERAERPVETGGGILADEMGLGKTLTMLAAIIRTAGTAKDFAYSIPNDVHLSVEQAFIPSRATLVVVPSPILLNEWLQEIKAHCTGLANINIYHSQGREGNPKVLADCDIVLSTYHIIAAESNDSTSPLWQINWFRVVLDEAHIIRRMTTKLFKATKKLRAKLRWCLTGTPIQNSLEDLAALINFIRSSPLEDLYMFKKHIISPLMKNSQKGVENLRQLLDSVCLRRTKQLLDLPEVVTEPRLLNFSPEEKKRYIDTRDKLVRTIRQSRFLPRNKGYLGVFQLQLQLRRLCNHGTFQKPSLSVEEFDPDQAIIYLKEQKIAKCEVCSTTVTGIHNIEEQRSGNFTTCGHLLCSKCIPKMKQALERIEGRDGCLKCSLCPETIFGEYLVTEDVSSKPMKTGSKHLSAWQYFDKDGRSTKISAVIADIEQHKAEGKSIVFSCWTRSLDLIGIFLKTRNIAFVRIDGSHTLSQRKWILKTYQKEPKIKILLMTTGTGAIGLNLTVANCVYILEPQWNPMVEAQAIARVNRLGQKRNVRVVKYIMKGTVEELELQTQQIRKLEYAKVGWKEDNEAAMKITHETQDTEMAL